MPLVDDSLAKLGDLQFFSKENLANVFHQIPVATEDRDKTGSWHLVLGLTVKSENVLVVALLKLSLSDSRSTYILLPSPLRI